LGGENSPVVVAVDIVAVLNTIAFVVVVAIEIIFNFQSNQMSVPNFLAAQKKRGGEERTALLGLAVFVFLTVIVVLLLAPVDVVFLVLEG